MILSCTLSAEGYSCGRNPLRTASDAIIAACNSSLPILLHTGTLDQQWAYCHSQTDDSYDDVGMQILPAQMTDGRLARPVVCCFPAGLAADRPLHSADLAKIG